MIAITAIMSGAEKCWAELGTEFTGVVGTHSNARSKPSSGKGAASLEILVDIQARKLYLKVFLWFSGRSERYLRMETRVLHRISIQDSLA